MMLGRDSDFCPSNPLLDATWSQHMTHHCPTPVFSTVIPVIPVIHCPFASVSCHLGFFLHPILILSPPLRLLCAQSAILHTTSDDAFGAGNSKPQFVAIIATGSYPRCSSIELPYECEHVSLFMNKLALSYFHESRFSSRFENSRIGLSGCF